jgi:endonuclease/exonuclease/phosphatase family metal-dependent hydrolase
MNIMYSNISGGLIFAGQTYGEMLFSKVSLEHYIDYFRGKHLDILCLSEVHLENKSSSEMVARIASELKLPHHSSLALSQSHLDTSKRLGMSVISRHPITSQEEFTIPSPGIEVDRPNGDHWKMFDKGAQRVHLDIDGTEIAVVNFSYFPFHHFNRRVVEPEFKPLRQQLLEILVSDRSIPTIITGDFNSKGYAISEAFPELFADHALQRAIAAETTVIGATEQLDQILYQPKYFTSGDDFAEENGSDHLAIGATIQLRRPE